MRGRLCHVSALVVAVALAIPGAAAAAKPSGQVFTVPGKIRSDCSVAVDDKLTAWLAGVPDGSTVRFAQNGCYGQNGTITVAGKNRLVLDGRGSEFRALTLGDSHRSNLQFQGGSDLTVQNLAVRGFNPSGVYDPSVEWQHGIAVNGVQGMTVANVQVRETFGDGIDIWHGAPSPACGDDASSSRDIMIRNATLERIGRQGVAVVDGERVTVQDSTIGPVAWWGVDLETDEACELSRHVTVTRNTFPGNGRGVLGDYSAGGDPQVGDVTVSNNVQTAPTGGTSAGECLSPVSSLPPAGVYHPDYVFTGNTLLARRYAFNLTRMQNVQIDSNNVTYDTSHDCSPVMGVNLIDSHMVAITNNVFSGATGAYTADGASTQVSASGNTPN